MSLPPSLTLRASCRSAHWRSPLSHIFIPDPCMGDPLSSVRARVTRVIALEALLECSITERPRCHSLSQVCVCSREDNNETTCSYKKKKKKKSSFAFLSSEILSPMEVEMITTSPCLKQGEHSNTSELLLTLIGYKIKLYDQNFFFFLPL